MRNAFSSYLDYHALSVNNCKRPEGEGFEVDLFDSRGVKEFKEVVKVRRFSKDIMTEMNRFIDKLNEDYWNVLDGELIAKLV